MEGTCCYYRSCEVMLIFLVFSYTQNIIIFSEVLGNWPKMNVYSISLAYDVLELLNLLGN